MKNMYRCNKCGGHVEAESIDGLICVPKSDMPGNDCNGKIFTQVNEENKNKLPPPTHIYEYDPYYDSSVCNDLPGFCPCGDYITHPKDEPCDVINEEVDKQTRTWACQCATAFCRCGAYVAHKVDEPCTAKGTVAFGDIEKVFKFGGK